ncbi:hypothetical protein D3C87_279120 [compost metagenome]
MDGGVTLSDNTELETISDEQFDTSRWSIHSRLIFKHIDGDVETFYYVDYSEGATEQQDERPFEYEDDEIECFQAEPKKVEVIQYFAIEVKE